MIKTLYVTLYPQNIYNDISLYGKKKNMRGCCYNMHPHLIEMKLTIKHVQLTVVMIKT